MKVKKNIEQENRAQKQRFQKMKEKYDREGVEFVQDEMDLAQRTTSGMPAGAEYGSSGNPRERAHTMRGARKPGQESTGTDIYDKPKGLNMGGGADNDTQKNPLTMIINAAKKSFNG